MSSNEPTPAPAAGSAAEGRPPENRPEFRVGLGYDIHRTGNPLQGARPMMLGGVAIQGAPAIVAHSDGDALCHAVTDAILGALALPDIGQLFPDTDPKYRGADSRTFLEAAVAKAASMGYRVVNVDATVILERPKLSPQKEAVRASLASMLGVEASRVNVKGKTHETLDALGRGEGVEVHAVVLMARG